MKSPVTLLSSFFDDVKRLEPSVKGTDRDIITIGSRFENEGYGFLSVALTALCDALDKGLSLGCFTCPTNFSKVRGGALPKFLSGLLCEVFDTKTGHLLEQPNVGVVKCLREGLRMFKKVQLTANRSKKLEKQAVAKFVETDDYITRFIPCARKVSFLRAVSKVVLHDLDDFEVDEILYKHGPGGVAEKLKANRKWVSLREGLRNDSSLAFLLGFDSQILSDRGGYDLATSYSGLPLFESYEFHKNSSQHHTTSGIAKLLVVPKDATSLRTITAEPVVKQFFQQGLNTHLRDKISRCGVLSLCLALTDQSENQKLALEGSLNDKYSTLDLSSASDLLSTNVVCDAFHTRTRFLNLAFMSRSAFVDTGTSGIIELQKFAGMGNALTFPVQSVVFALLAICGILELEGREPSYVNVKRAARRVRVFGDDIIVDTSSSHSVVEWLTSFGLKVNQKKSFLGGFFKESCGVDAYKGYDVTPVYVRHEPFFTGWDPSKLSSLVSTCNQFWMRGLYKTSDTLRRTIEGLIKLPLVSRNSASIGWHSRVDTSIAQKWDEKLQRLVFRGYVVESCKQDDNIVDDSAALLKSLVTAKVRDSRLSDIDKYGRQARVYSIDDKHLERSVARFKTRIRPRWVPANAGN